MSRIYKADQFGLAQLHQLRGRIGRSSLKGFAYFTLERSNIKKNAERRLKALQTMDSLGAGINLANHDLDIRGIKNAKVKYMLLDDQTPSFKQQIKSVPTIIVLDKNKKPRGMWNGGIALKLKVTKVNIQSKSTPRNRRNTTSGAPPKFIHLRFALLAVAAT